MKPKKYLAFSLVITVCLASSISSLADDKLPKYLIKENKQFFENQLIAQEKAFLDELSNALFSLSKLNQETLKLLEIAFPAGKKYYKKITRDFERSAKKSTTKLIGQRKPSGILTGFMKKHFAARPDVQSELESLILDYKSYEDVDSYIGDELKNTLFSEGAYHYYQRCLESFNNSYGEDFSELLQRDITFYNYLGQLAQNHKVKELKNLLPSSTFRTETAQQLIRMQIVDKMSMTNRSWAREIILKTLEMLYKQLELNKTFSLAASSSLNEITTPEEAKLPDLVVASIELLLPPEISKNMTVEIIAEIKNAGDLSTQHSKALLIFPNGSKKGRPVPRLLPKASVKLTWRYKLSRGGEQAFHVIANYDERAWEQNFDNNSTSRTLVVPHCQPSQ